MIRIDSESRTVVNSCDPKIPVHPKSRIVSHDSVSTLDTNTQTLARTKESGLTGLLGYSGPSLRRSVAVHASTHRIILPF